MFVKGGSALRDVIISLNESECGIALVVDDNRKLLGTVTDGDIRRALLKGVKLEGTAAEIMHDTPLTCSGNMALDQIRLLMLQKQVRQIPLVDDDGRVVDLVVVNELVRNRKHENRVIIMAGGLGTRLRPLTESVPKPMLEVGGKPILQGIIENLVGQGLYKFTICLNYLGSMIEDYFGDGSAFGASITYTREERRMGTGGALSLLEELPSHPCIVMNGDILTKLDFRRLRDFHTEHNAEATIALNEYDFSIPFGVIETHDGMVTRMLEKPTHTSFVNAGIYMLSPSVFEHIQSDTAFDMPELMEKLIALGKGVAGFPIFEYWLDIGRHNDLAAVRETGILKNQE